VEKKYDHYDKINGIFVSPDDNMFLTCSEDGRILLYNLFSYQLIRSLKNPNNSPVTYALLSGAPLFSIVFFSKDNEGGKMFSYNINGQFLS
jgi:WD40 repeat protein